MAHSRFGVAGGCVNETWWIRPDQLDDDQKRVIVLPLGQDHLVVGPPGSGKSNLLLLRASYAVKAGCKDIVVLTFTRTLQEFISTGATRYSFSSDKVKTCVRWQRELLYQYGVDYVPPDDFEEQRRGLVEQLNRAIDSLNIQPFHEIILLDEAQDYWPEEVALFKRLGKTIFAVGDSRQKIYKGDDSLASLRGLPHSTVSTLRYHYRNGLRICRLADALSKDRANIESLADTSNYDEKARPSSVEVHDCTDVSEQADQIIERLSRQRQAYPDELLGVICPRRDDLAHIWQRLRASHLGSDAVLQVSEDYSSFVGKKICLCSTHSAKGLEFRALHFAGCDILKMPHPRNVVFTGVTRAKTSLDIYHSSSMPGFVEQALASLELPPDPPSLGDLFAEEEEEP